MQQQDVAFVSAVYDSIASGQGIEPAIAVYTRHFPDIRFSWQAMCHATKEYFASFVYNYSDSDIAAYLEICHLNEIPAMAARLPQNGIVKSEYFLTTADYEATDIYDLFFRERDDLNSSRGLWAYREGQSAAMLTVDIPRRYSLPERIALDHSLAAILPHLRSAFSLMMELDLRRTRDQAAEFWLEALPSAAFVVSAEGRVSAFNTRARAMSRDDAALPGIGTDGCLAYGSNAQREAVDTYLRRVLVSRVAEGPFAVPAPGARRLSAYAMPLPSSAHGDDVLGFFREKRREVLLIVVDANDVAGAPVETISTVLRISPAEARLVARLCEGGDMREAADDLGVSYHTARAQLASATDKLGVQRQSELVGMASRVLAQLRGFGGGR